VQLLRQRLQKLDGKCFQKQGLENILKKRVSIVHDLNNIGITWFWWEYVVSKRTRRDFAETLSKRFEMRVKTIFQYSNTLVITGSFG
jgi:hypothetical protein